MANAGRIDFPSHMKTIHQDWLNHTGSDDMTGSGSMVDLMEAAIGGSPFAYMAAYDPATPVAAMDTAVSTFDTLVSALSEESDWEAKIDAVVAKVDAAVYDDAYVDADIAAFGDELDDQIDNIVLPRFKGGMRDINASMTSAFVIGEALIEGMRDRDVAKYGTDLRQKLHLQRNDFVLKGTEAMLRDLFGRIDLGKAVMHYTIEANRMKIIAEKEQTDADNTISINDGRWDLETYQYGSNLLAAIGGGTLIPTGASSGLDDPSTGQSALAGALAGMAAGSAIGGDWGAVIGGALGGIAGGLFG
jgi:hypothetical protein